MPTTTSKLSISKRVLWNAKQVRQSVNRERIFTAHLLAQLASKKLKFPMVLGFLLAYIAQIVEFDYNITPLLIKLTFAPQKK